MLFIVRESSLPLAGPSFLVTDCQSAVLERDGIFEGLSPLRISRDPGRFVACGHTGPVGLTVGCEAQEPVRRPIDWPVKHLNKHLKTGVDRSRPLS